jgi:hypothetical protein
MSLTASNLPPTASALFFQGQAQVSGGAGTTFGDGLRCAVDSVVRIGTRTALNGVASLGGAGVSIAQQGGIPVVGATRHYQVWYRNSALFCTAAVFNLTNGTTLRWLP